MLLGNHVELHQPVENNAHHVLLSGIPIDDGDIPQIQLHGNAYLSFCPNCSTDDNALLLMHKIGLSHSSDRQTTPLLRNRGSLILVSSDVRTSHEAGIVSEQLNSSDFSYIKDSGELSSQTRYPVMKLSRYGIVHIQTSNWFLSSGTKRTSKAVLLEVEQVRTLFIQDNTFANDATGSMLTVAKLDSDYLLFENNHFRGNTHWMNLQPGDPIIINSPYASRDNTFEPKSTQNSATFKKMLLGDSSDFAINFEPLSSARYFSHRIAIRQAEMNTTTAEPTTSSDGLTPSSLGLAIATAVSAGLMGCFCLCGMVYCCCDVTMKCSQDYKDKAHARRMYTLQGVQASGEGVDGPLDTIQGCVADCPCSGSLLAQIYIHTPVIWYYMKRGGAGAFRFFFGRLIAHSRH